MKIPNYLRDRMVTEFRQKVLAETGIIPFEHQASWMALTDGQILVPEREELPKLTVRLPDDSLVVRSLVPRSQGRVKVMAELGAYKVGKSFGAALWATGFAAVPDGRVYLVGIEYDMCVPEFDNLLEFLISSRGLSLPYKVLQNRPKDGRLWLELDNGARFEARSWERSESLKGKEVDAYVFCEAYQLPGIECFMGIKQNLRAREGYAIFPTTPDNPWVSILHENGHDNPEYPEWACQCGVPASVNPYTYDAQVDRLDEKMMTREKYSIAYLGKIGTYLGRVFAYQRGEMQFTPSSHPQLWHDTSGPPEPANFRLPSNWTVQIGADTGTYFGAIIAAFDENGNAFVLDEIPNYRYVGGTIELMQGWSLATWAEAVKRRAAIWGARPFAWVDTNSQFKAELWNNYHFNLLGNQAGVEARTETTREYFQHKRIFLAPWLKLLPWELEHAQWPPEATTMGKIRRVKRNDHLLDGLEHLCSRHPIGRKLEPIQPARYPTHHERPPRTTTQFDTHMGSQ